VLPNAIVFFFQRLLSIEWLDITAS